MWNATIRNYSSRASIWAVGTPLGFVGHSSGFRSLLGLVKFAFGSEFKGSISTIHRTFSPFLVRICLQCYKVHTTQIDCSIDLMQIWQLLISINWISSHAWLPYICLWFSFFSNVYHFACHWPTALKFGCITNFDMLFLVMGFISLVDEIQFMLISSRHICIRSISYFTSFTKKVYLFPRIQGISQKSDNCHDVVVSGWFLSNLMQ